MTDPLDPPLTLRQAVDLQDLGGVFSEKQLRGAVSRGELEVERHGRRMFVTRSGIRRWRERSTSLLTPPVKNRPSFPVRSSVMEGDKIEIAKKAALDTIAKLREKSRR